LEDDSKWVRLIEYQLSRNSIIYLNN
jgi:hypothetical protein